MGQNVYTSEIKRIAQQENGVISVAALSVFNNVGGQYSSSQTPMPYLDLNTREIEAVDETIFAQPNQTYQIRFPAKDIKVRVKNLATINFT
jgi:poly-beta-hydroxyalkanoate depolymerase